MKKRMALLLAAAVMLSMCACGGATSSEESKATVSSEERTEQDTSTVEADATSVDEATVTETEVSSNEDETAVDNDLIVFDDVVLVDNDTLTMKLVNFYAQDCNWADGSQNEKYFTVNVTNKSDHDIILNPGQLYLNSEQAYQSGLILLSGGNYNDAKAVFSGLGDYKDSAANVQECDYQAATALFAEGSYEEAIQIFETITDYNDAADLLAQAQHELMLVNYADVLELLTQEVWYFNGGSDTTLNNISFTTEAATIAQVYFDGNGKHDGNTNECEFMVDDNNITLVLADGSDYVIPYVTDGSSLTLGDHEYYTLAEIDAALQGYWGVTTYSFGKHEFYICFNNGQVSSENAAAALLGAPGEYYYYGPYSGTYTLNFGGLDTEMRHGNNWFFNIIDGEVAVLHYEAVCSRASGFPGMNGYSF